MKLLVPFLMPALLTSIAAETLMTGVNTAGNSISGHFTFPVAELIDGWELVINFTTPMISIQEMENMVGKIVNHSDDGLNFVIANHPSHGIVRPHSTLDIVIQGQFAGSTAPSAMAELINLGFDGQTVPTFNPSSAKYDYNEVLMKSILFYEAQRSGKLPANNRIPWRGDSAMSDQGDNGEDLTGGWYDAGDHIKFGFPMSGSVTLLAWSLIAYKDAYLNAGQLEYMYDCIRWPLEWMLKCHVSPEELYIQVGKPDLDHHFWGRPEDMTMSRPSYKVTPEKAGSDVAGEYAAAMAAGYLAFKEKDPTFARTLLTHAKQINDFAVKYKGRFTETNPLIANSYTSSHYEDELTWAGAWLYKATNETKYFNQANQFFNPSPSNGQSWDDKSAGYMVLLYNITQDDKYKSAIEGTFSEWLPGGSVPYTPNGLAFRTLWGSLRHSANMAFLALLAADDGVNASVYRRWAMSQIHYALGDTGRSFVVGFGNNPPTQPHHRAASCPWPPTPCSEVNLHTNVSDPHILYGGLVGGPDKNGHYEDNREDYVKNEVACDYNAGFHGAIAGLQSLSLRGLL